MKALPLGVYIEINRKTGAVLAVYFKIRNGKAAEVREFARGAAFANYGSDGQLLGIELLGPCEITVLDRIARKEAEAVKNFLRQSIPREMAVASALPVAETTTLPEDWGTGKGAGRTRRK